MMHILDDTVNDDEVQKATCNWPTKLYLSAMVFALVTLVVFTPTLSGRWTNNLRGGMQALILLVFMGRYLLAHRREEQSKAWIPYVVVMFLATPIWLIVEPLFFKLFYLGRQLFAGG